MSNLQVRHVADSLRLTYADLVDLSDVGTADDEQRDKALLTRALAAYAIRRFTAVEPETAASCITDGTNDNGIDAVYVDLAEARLFVVQTKWDSNGTGSLAVGDAHKFVAGVKDLTDEQFDRFNDRLVLHIPQIEAALRDPRLKITMIIAMPGASVFAEHTQRVFTDLESEMNEIQPMLEVRILGLSELHKAITSDMQGTRIDLNVTLEHWGQLTEPFAAYYGVVDALTVASWYDEYGDQLFSQNLRRALGHTAVNSSLEATLTGQPENFWYFNNGITALCDSIAKTARGGTTRTFGEFSLEGVSVVNGAQTVASVAEAVRLAPDTAALAKLWVRFISLQGCPADFAGNVTRATNTQNTVESRDFVALDPEQDRLRTEMLLSLKKLYSVQRGEHPPQAENGCTVTDATIALACAQPDSNLAVLAKSAVGRLWDDISKPPYKILFNGGMTAHRVWRCVAVMRAVDAWLATQRLALGGRSRAVEVQGNRMVLHVVFRSLDMSRIDDLDSDWGVELARVPDLCELAIASLTWWVEADYSANYITSLFKNASKCRLLASKVHTDLEAGTRR